MSHLNNLLKEVPHLKEKNILDLGSGRGDFLIDLAKNGFTAEGIEVSERYIEDALKRAGDGGVSIRVTKGVGESLPYKNESFGFINAAEVLEHVQDPKKVLSEMSRVLTKNGMAYVSIPNRFGFFDPHFHLFLVNWLPRRFSEPFISFFKKQKDYTKTHAGYQKLSDMHYMTRGQFEKLCKTRGLLFTESREERIRRVFPKLGSLLVLLYRIYAFFFISTHHGFVRF